MSRTLEIRVGALATATALALSRAALDAPLLVDAELSVVELTTAATVLGAFQRHHGAADDRPLLRRGSGGPFVRVAPGTLHVMLRLKHPAALVPCDARRIVNRHVRPLLRGLTRTGALAHYFGRDWISVAHRPVGQVGFAHDTRTQRTVFEAFVAIAEPVVPSGRGSLLGKEPGTLASVTGRDFDARVVCGRIVDAYAELDGCERRDGVLECVGPDVTELGNDPPWAATSEEAIGTIGAGVDRAGVLRLGGDLLASRDALDRVAARVSALSRTYLLPEASAEAVGAIVDEELSGSHVALDGVRSMASLRDVLVRAM